LAGRLLSYNSINNFLSLNISAFIIQVLGFFTIPYIARKVGIEAFGILGIAQSTQFMFVMLSDMGTETLSTKEIAQNRNNIQEVFPRFFTIRIFFAIVSFIVLLLYLFVVRIDFFEKVIVLLYGISIFLFALLIEWFFQGIERATVVSGFRILKVLIYSSLIFLFVRDAGDTVLVPIFYNFSLSLVVVLMLLSYRKEFGGIKVGLKLINISDNIRILVPIGLGRFFEAGFLRFPVIILGILVATTEVGIYNCANQIILFGTLLIVNLQFIIFPILARLLIHSHDSYIRYLYLIVKYLFLVGTPLTLIGMIFSEGILHLLYGQSEIALQTNNIAAASFIFKVLALSVLIMLIRAPLNNTFIIERKQKLFLKLLSVSFMVNTGLSILFIKWFGIKGASLAVLSGEIVLFLLVLFYSDSFSRYNFRLNIMAMVTFLLLMPMVFVEIHHDKMLWYILGGMVIYVWFLRLSGVIKNKELKFIVQA